MTNIWRKYAAFFMISFKQSWLNKGNLSGGLLFLIILLFTYNRLWEVIGLEQDQIGLNATFVWYLLFAEMIILSAPRSERILADDVKSGTMAYYINKPVSFFLMRYAEALGAMAVSYLSMGALGSLAALLLTEEPPFQWWQFPFIFIACGISSAINTLLYTAIGLSALWLENIRTLSMAVQRLAFIFGGAIFPLTIYPEWFVDIAQWTPFYAVYYLTIRLVYDFSWLNLGEACLLNFLWTSGIVAFIAYAYRKLNRRVNVYGG